MQRTMNSSTCNYDMMLLCSADSRCTGCLQDLDAHFLSEDIDRFTTSVPHAHIRLVEGVGHSILLDPEGQSRYLVELDSLLTTLP